MKKNIIYNEVNIDKIIQNLKKDWLENIHILADFDRTLTKAFVDWETRSSLISVLRSEWILWEEYSKKAYDLFDKYHPIEVDPNIDLEEKKKQMQIWWEKHLDLLVETWLKKQDIEKAVDLWKVEFRVGIKEFVKKLQENNIPLVIISANWLWAESIEYFFKRNNLSLDNIFIISNSFIYDENRYAVDYKKPVIHTFNKDETVLTEFPEIYQKIKNKKNVILLWDSLGDPNMIDWFDYDNLIKIWFFNNSDEKWLEDYKKLYDVVILWDWTFNFINNLLNKIKND